MTVDPSLWQAFHSAKDALLDALRSSAAETNYPHVLSRPPTERSDALRIIHQGIAEFDEQQRQLESAKDDLSETIGCIARGVQRAHQSTSPVGVLPPELLRNIIHHSVDRQNHKEILSLASVCSLWRAVVHAERSLFAEANWANWNVELLDLWNARSRGCPLHVRINEKVSKRLSDDRYAQILQSGLTRWASLSLEVLSDNFNVKPIQTLFNQSPLNSLKSLMYRIGLDDQLDLVAPNLISIQGRGPLPILTPTPLAHLKHISLTPYQPGEWVFTQTFLNSSACQSLTELYIDLGELDDSNWPTSMELVFASLRHLRINSAYGHEVTEVFELAAFPVLEEITLGRLMDVTDRDEVAAVLGPLVSLFVE